MMSPALALPRVNQSASSRQIVPLTRWSEPPALAGEAVARESLSSKSSSVQPSQIPPSSVAPLQLLSTPSQTSAGSGPQRPYDVREVYAEGDVVTHPTFGTGIVLELVSHNRMRTLFANAERVLIMAHGARPPEQV